MRLLAATDNDIFPPTFGGPQRTFGLLRGLAREHDVRALCVVPNRNAAPAEETAAGVRLRRRRAWYTSLAWRLERMRLAPVHVAAEWHAARAVSLARELGGGADVLLAEINLTGLFGTGLARLEVYASQNVEYDYFRFERRVQLAPGAWARRRREFEARAVARAGLTVTCTDEDAARMRELHGAPSEKLVTVPNGWDETAITAPDAAARARARAAFGFGADDHVALFLGSDVPHNRAAVATLVERVMPALAGTGARLLVAGTVSRMLAGRRESWLVTHPGAVDIAPVLHAADAGLNPVAMGAGSNVKLPTYLAAGLAVVTTPAGLRGYPRLRAHVTCADVDDFAEALRARPLGWNARGEAMPADVRAHAWGELGAALGHELERRLGARDAGETAGRTAAGGMR